MVTSNRRASDDTYRFAKLRGAENYEQWAKNMKGELMSSDLWVYIKDPESRPEPPALVSRPDDTEERAERVFQRSDRRAAWKAQQNSCIGKIYSQCTFAVQLQIDALKSETAASQGNTSGTPTALGDGEWTPKELWENIQGICTETRWRVKWDLVQRLGDTQLRAGNKAEARAWIARCLDLRQKFHRHEVTIDELLSILMLNSLPPRFDVVKSIKRNEARESEIVPDMMEIFNSVMLDLSS